jgi:hypothetical protein
MRDGVTMMGKVEELQGLGRVCQEGVVFVIIEAGMSTDNLSMRAPS